MSLNNGINAVIALLEDRPAAAKEFLRAPTSDVQNISGVMIRLDQAARKNAAKEIREILKQAMSIQPSDDKNPDQIEAFYEGVTSMEYLLEMVASDLERN
jgi:hypothetical protein